MENILFQDLPLGSVVRFGNEHTMRFVKCTDKLAITKDADYIPMRKAWYNGEIFQTVRSTLYRDSFIHHWANDTLSNMPIPRLWDDARPNRYRGAYTYGREYLLNGIDTSGLQPTTITTATPPGRIKALGKKMSMTVLAWVPSLDEYEMVDRAGYLLAGCYVSRDPNPNSFKAYAKNRTAQPYVALDRHGLVHALIQPKANAEFVWMPGANYYLYQGFQVHLTESLFSLLPNCPRIED